MNKDWPGLTQRTSNPARSVYVESQPRAAEDAYQGWLYAQLSRMPYLCKSLVREAICSMLVPELSCTFDKIVTENFLAGWDRGYKDGLASAAEIAGTNGSVAGSPRDETVGGTDVPV